MRVRKAWSFVCEGEQRIAFGTTERAARLLAQKKHHEGENETETDCEGERDDGHGGWLGCALMIGLRERTGSAEVADSWACLVQVT